MSDDMRKRDHPTLELFLRLYARVLVCPCRGNTCVQCRLDKDAMRVSTVLGDAIAVDPAIKSFLEAK